MFNPLTGEYTRVCPRGFSVAEVMISMLILSVVALLVLPKILVPHESRQAAALIQESFTMTGQLFKARKNDPAYPPVDGIGFDERFQFRTYLQNHLKYLSNPYPEPTESPDPCDINQNFLLPGGTVIGAMCDVYPNLHVDIYVPLKSNPDSNLPFGTWSMPEDVYTRYTIVLSKFSDLYTTAYGDPETVQNPTLCTYADVVLKLTEQCPVTGS